MIMKAIVVEGMEYTIKPLTRRQFKSLQPPDETTLDRTLEMILPADQNEYLEDRPLFEARKVFDAIMDFSRGDDAEKN